MPPADADPRLVEVWRSILRLFVVSDPFEIFVAETDPVGRRAMYEWLFANEKEIADKAWELVDRASKLHGIGG